MKLQFKNKFNQGLIVGVNEDWLNKAEDFVKRLKTQKRQFNNVELNDTKMVRKYKPETKE